MCGSHAGDDFGKETLVFQHQDVSIENIAVFSPNLVFQPSFQDFELRFGKIHRSEEALDFFFRHVPESVHLQNESLVAFQLQSSAENHSSGNAGTLKNPFRFLRHSVVFPESLFKEASYRSPRLRFILAFNE